MVKFVIPEKFIWEEHKSDYGRFVVEPLEKGYGTTLGNALRRILLSSIEGAAPTAVKFEGAWHEFATLPGVAEDLTEIVLNIKELRFVLHGDSPVFVNLKKRGPGEVLASDFDLPSQLELLTPDKLIATLDSEDAEIEMTVRIDKDKGFVLSEDIQEIFDITTLGWIPLDADFSPVKKVAFRVEDTRVGRRTDYNRLIMDVWTDGSITPKDAVVKAANILIDHFSLLRDKLIEAMVTVAAVSGGAPQEQKEPEIFEKTLEEAGLKGRALKVLEEAGITTVGQLVGMTRSQVLALKGLGKKSLASIEEFLSSMGFDFAGGKEG